MGFRIANLTSRQTRYTGAAAAKAIHYDAARYGANDEKRCGSTTRLTQRILRVELQPTGPGVRF